MMTENLPSSYHSYYELPLSLWKLSINWTEISYTYASIYTKSFLDVLYAIRQDNVEKKESLYDSWLTDLDGIFGKELRSSQFTSMLEDYLKSLGEFRATCSSMGYPADYYEMLFYNMKKYFLNALALSIQDPIAYYSTPS